MLTSCYYIFSNAYPKLYCEHLVKLAEQFPKEPGLTMANDSNIRQSQIAFVDCLDKQVKSLHDDIMQRMHIANQAFGMDVTWLPQFQFTSYDVKDHYDWHIDTMITPTNEQRKISVTIQLTDPTNYDGGDFEIEPSFGDIPDRNLLRQQGTIIFFPSFIRHRVTPVTKGLRHSIVGWFYGPAFR